MCALDKTHADLSLVLCNSRCGDCGSGRDDFVDMGRVEVNRHGRSARQGDDECLFAEGCLVRQLELGKLNDQGQAS